jgi:phage tail tape-measure protein
MLRFLLLGAMAIGASASGGCAHCTLVIDPAQDTPLMAAVRNHCMRQAEREYPVQPRARAGQISAVDLLFDGPRRQQYECNCIRAHAGSVNLQQRPAGQGVPQPPNTSSGTKLDSTPPR